MARINGTVPTPITMAINLFFNPIRKKDKRLRSGFGFTVMGHPIRVSWNISDTHHSQYRSTAFKFHAFYKKSGGLLSGGLFLSKD
jgi:hypothetical protein